MNAYQRGQGVRLSAVFRASSGSLSDPVAVTCRVKKGDGTTVTYTYPATIVKDSVGNYHQDLLLDPTAYGPWTYRWEGTVSPDAALEGMFEVLQSSFFSP